ncbi:MAG: hypothetical protein GC181_11290 [Bacteroidetes bacterium]|nr:hypothetical protein [Bacteroidota bacterium]
MLTESNPLDQHLMNTKAVKKYEPQTVLILAFCGIFTGMLFYIDEGYNDFRWMLSAGNWIAFAGYITILFTLSILTDLIIYRFFRIEKRALWSAFIGCILGTISIMIFYAKVIA